MEARNVSFLGELCLRTKCMIPIKSFEIKEFLRAILAVKIERDS